MNGYVALYRGERFETRAETLYSAHRAAIEYFQRKYPRRKVRGGYDGVTTYLVELPDGTPNVQTITN